MNVEHLLEENSFRLEEGSFNNRPVMRLQGFELIAMLLEKLGSYNFAIIFMIAIFSSSAFLVYLISLKSTESPTAAWFSALLISTSPLLIINSLSYHELLFALPLMLMFLYFFMQNKLNITALIFSFVILTFLNLASFYLLFILIIYFLIMNAIGIKNEKKEFESVLLMLIIFFGVLTIFSIVFQDFGRIPIFYNNLPTELLIQNFSGFSLLYRIFSPGLIVVLFSAVGAYYIISRANEKAVLPLSMLIGGVILSVIGSEKLFLAIFGISASIIAAHGVSYFLQWISISKASEYKKIIFLILAIIIAVSGLTQGLIGYNNIKSNSASEDELLAFQFVSNLAHKNIFVPLELTSRTEYYTKKNVFIKGDFTGVYDSNIYYDKYSQLMNTRSSVEALRLLNENDIGIMIFYSNELPFYLNEEVIEKTCFTRYNFNSLSVFEVDCKVRNNGKI
jgi:hypothetical protein